MPAFREEIIGDARLILGDARDVLPTLGRFDAAVTDPPYGIGEARQKNGRNPVPGKSRLGTRCAVVNWGSSDWDDKTAPEELSASLRAARWAIVFGGNYYDLPPSQCWLVWDKLNSGDFADGELAWTNLPGAVRIIQYRWNGMIRQNNEPRGDHPTQKPVGVMRWCLQRLPSGSRSVLDPFMGSGTTGVAAVAEGMAFTGIEREGRYFDAACRRIEEAHRQPRLFAEPPPKIVQPSMFSEDA
jgi:DNA modification methylase